MSTGTQPEAVWYFPPQKNNRWKMWLLVGISVVALAVVIGFLFVVLPNGFRPEATPAPTATPTTSASVTPTPSSSPSPSPTASETPVVEPTQPSTADPDLSSFAAQVQPVLDDASTGLGFAAEDGGESGADDIVLLQQDAERLSDAIAPSSIADAWSDRTSAYLSALSALEAAYRSGDGVTSAEKAAAGALADLRSLIGL